MMKCLNMSCECIKEALHNTCLCVSDGFNLWPDTWIELSNYSVVSVTIEILTVIT